MQCKAIHHISPLFSAHVPFQVLEEYTKLQGDIPDFLEEITSQSNIRTMKTKIFVESNQNEDYDAYKKDIGMMVKH